MSSIDRLFAGPPVLGVPTHAEVYAHKAPGVQDGLNAEGQGEGDWCSNPT